MNSKQRRKAYRAMPKAGTVITWKRPGGRTGTGTVIGLKPTEDRYRYEDERMNKPSVYRVHVKNFGPGSGTCCPKVSTIIKSGV